MVDLAALRRAVGLTQIQLADLLGTTQGQISRMERQQDMLVSTLASYLQALGAQASLVIEVADETLTYDLTERKEDR